MVLLLTVWRMAQEVGGAAARNILCEVQYWLRNLNRNSIILTNSLLSVHSLFSIY